MHRTHIQTDTHTDTQSHVWRELFLLQRNLHFNFCLSYTIDAVDVLVFFLHNYSSEARTHQQSPDTTVEPCQEERRKCVCVWVI